MPTLLLALGGNALIRKGQTGTIEEQFENLRLPLKQAARLAMNWRLIITHGNGPQVGDLLLKQECCTSDHPLPLEILVAQTQGQIGYMIESTLDTELMQLGPEAETPLVSLLSYVVVDPNDPAFKNPTKPIGPVLTEERQRQAAYPTRKTAKGWRRVVASPHPLTIVEKREIKQLIENGFIVICCGGGGIPVIREGRRFCGVDAVIDKDLASMRLAGEIDADLFVIATDVNGLYLNYGEPYQRMLEGLNLTEAEELLEKGVLPPGTVGPKLEACVRYLQNGGKRAVICSIRQIEAAVAGEAGTQLVAY